MTPTLPEKYASPLRRVLDALRERWEKEGVGAVKAFAVLLNTSAGTVRYAILKPDRELLKASADELRDAAHQFEADAVATVFINWSLPFLLDAEAPVEGWAKAKASYEAAIQEYGSIEAHPEAVQAVMLIVDSREGVWEGSEVLTPHGAGQTFGPLEFRFWPSPAGYFVGLVPDPVTLPH